MDSYKKLFNNVVIFAVGNLGSKILSFLLVPLYTYYLSQSDYGTADLVLATSNMLMPIISAEMYEAVLRFIIDKNKKDDTSSIMSNALTITLIGYLVIVLFYPVLTYFGFLGSSLPFLYVLLFLQIIKQIFAQYARGIGKTKVFALHGIITTFFTGIFNILFLVVFDWGLVGYFMAFILGYAISILYLLLAVNPVQGIRPSKVNTNFLKRLFTYAAPLIPNSLMWWLINSSSRYFITGFIGLGANGLFAVSSKVPSLVNIVSQVFSQAWQLSAFEKYENDESSDFYTNIFDIYIGILFLVTGAVIIVLKPTFSIVFSTDFFNAWRPVPFLMLGSVFSAFSGFVGVAYTASKQTKGVFKTSIYGGIISLLLNLLFIPTLGIIGAGFSSMLSFLAMFLIRYYDTRNILELTINWTKLFSNLILILLQASILFIELHVILEIVITAGIFLILVLINRNVLKLIPFILKEITKKIKNRK